MSHPTPVPAHSTPMPLRAWAAAALLAAASAGASAQVYINVTTDQNWQESFDGRSLSQPSMGGLAMAHADGMSLQASDSTHWVGGPYVSAVVSHRFGLAGAFGTFETVRVTVAVESHFGNDLSADFTASHGFSIELLSNAAPAVGAGGGLVDVNCLGCGGHLINSTVTDAHGVTSAWPHDFTQTYSFSTLVERGLPDVARLGLGGYLGVGSTWATLRMDVLSITDSQGQALTWGADGFLQPVPEPASIALWLAGLAVLGGVVRCTRRP